MPRVKLFSNTIPAARAARLRLVWFAIGMAFGIGCGISASSPSYIADNSLAENSDNINYQQSADYNLKPARSADNEIENKANKKEDNKADNNIKNSFNNATNNPSKTSEIPELPALAPVLTPNVRGEIILPNSVSQDSVSEISYPQTHKLIAKNGDSFVSLLGKIGISAQEAHEILAAIGKKFDPREMNIHDVYNVTIDKLPNEEKPLVTKLSLPISKLSTLEVTRSSNGRYSMKKIDLPTVKKLARSGGKINSSLYETVTDSGLPSAMVSEIIKAYSYDVDFQRDIKEGDKIDVVFEKIQTEDGKTVGYGNVIYSELELGERELRIYRHTDKGGFSDYYNARGESVRKALLRTPINGARISSGFGMRNHPILGYSKMHQGVDFAASIGTPVYAAGDGVVSFSGQKGGYGNYLQIKHSKQYSSAYAHLSRFANGVAPGKKVKQGQIVAYVGSTGMSTGAHLHYEIHSNGKQVNPANVKFKTGNVLAGNELKSFKRNIVTLHAQLDNMQKKSGKMASILDSSSDSSTKIP